MRKITSIGICFFMTILSGCAFFRDNTERYDWNGYMGRENYARHGFAMAELKGKEAENQALESAYVTYNALLQAGEYENAQIVLAQINLIKNNMVKKEKNREVEIQMRNESSSKVFFTSGPFVGESLSIGGITTKKIVPLGTMTYAVDWQNTKTNKFGHDQYDMIVTENQNVYTILDQNGRRRRR